MGAMMLGPFMLKYEWIIFLLASLTAYLFMKLMSKEDRSFQELFLSSFLNAVLIGFIVYKFSSVIFQARLMMEEPLSILYSTGGTKGKLLGLLIAVIYLYKKYRKGNWPFKSWFTLIVYGIVTFFVGFWLFRTLFFLLV
ncbi:hypothetical protein RRV45_10445 [Bacillus sp. DTU_2020_1000418_1_SI_GHA_SEK_038]|uniref:hypothetical protein n=1 Tax=Bacillus sp. DTU_2020_1000418_1_SI_GHA_SEK_038 TaxID=3077585 RepID=UPI0028E7CE3D|nr:hypothetical protein [Bacillus sp. DTU_2020_1000418_1_SI_GHA_SEK_038]WNS77375.1 hypothetical protein RRV45_10445 [Bacillus sp. DTU_2020_1000418_1_SI_GHA_SEK_038]